MIRRQSQFRHRVLAGAVLIGLLLVPSAWGHGGHGKPELQFSLEPVALENPDAVVVKLGNESVTAAELAEYVRHVAAFQMKADLLQRDFLLHFWLIEGISRYYPDDINERFARLVQMEHGEPEYDQRLDEWVLAQADLYARIRHFYEVGKAAGLEDSASTRAVLDCFAQHAKAGFLEDVVSYGKMKPTIHGVRSFAEGLGEGEIVTMGVHYKDPSEAFPFQRKEARARWVGYRRDVLRASDVDKAYKRIETLDVPPDTVVARVGDAIVTMADFQAIYGPVPNDVNWNQIKKSRAAQLVRAYALAQEADRLGIVPPEIDDKIRMADRFYVAARRIAAEYGPAFFDRPGAEVDFRFMRELVYYPNLVKFEKYFLDESENMPDAGALWIDEAAIRSIRWDLKPAYTPEQAKYF